MLIRNTPELKKNDIKVYSCGSPNLKDFLINNDVHPIFSYKHNQNNRTIWVFIMCNDLSVLLTQWTNNKPTARGGEKIE